MAQRFNPFQQRAPQNVADLISGLLGDAQQGLVRGQEIRQTREGEQRTQGLEREELDFDKAMQMAELEIAQDANMRAQEKPEKALTFDQMIAEQAKGLGLDDLVKLKLRLSGKDQVKPASTSGARTAEIKGFLSGREKVPQNFEAFDRYGEPFTQTKLVGAPFTQGTRDSISTIAQGQPFPTFQTDASPIGHDVAGMPDSARAQITAGLQQKYGEQWDSLTPEDKEAIIQEQFRNPR